MLGRWMPITRAGTITSPKPVAEKGPSGWKRTTPNAKISAWNGQYRGGVGFFAGDFRVFLGGSTVSTVIKQSLEGKIILTSGPCDESHDPGVSNIIETHVLQILFHKESIFIMFPLWQFPPKSVKIPQNESTKKIIQKSSSHCFRAKENSKLTSNIGETRAIWIPIRLRSQLGLPHFGCHESTGTWGEVGRSQGPVDSIWVFFVGFWWFKGVDFLLVSEFMIYIYINLLGSSLNRNM